MADEPTRPGGWLPPRAEGAGPAPRYERGPEAPPGSPPAPAEPPPTGWQPPVPPPAGAAPPQQWQQPPPTFTPAQAATGSNPLAVAALVLGIAGLVILVLSLGLGFFLSVPLSVGAWVCGAMAKNRMRSGAAPGGAGMAKAGLILGIVGVALGVAAAVVWIILIASGLDLNEFQDDLERELERQRDRDDTPAAWR